MTQEEWKRRCTQRIYRAVKKAGRVRIRDLKRATHYNRGPEEGIAIWYEALDFLGKSKQVVIERDADGLEIFILSTAVAKTMCFDSRGKSVIYQQVRG